MSYTNVEEILRDASFEHRAEAAELILRLEEYADLATLTLSEESDVIENRLVAEFEWSRETAVRILDAVSTLGAFGLRSALAIAIVLNHEDGSET